MVVRLLQAVRDRVRRLRHAGTRTEGQLPLVQAAHPKPAARVMARIGLQLYTVRDALAADPEGTLRTVAELGYDGVELFGDFGETVLLDELGLAVAGRHIGFDADVDALRSAGFDRVALAWIDPVETADDRDAAVERIVELGSVHAPRASSSASTTTGARCAASTTARRCSTAFRNGSGSSSTWAGRGTRACRR